MIVLLTGATGNLGPAVRAAFERGGYTVAAVSRTGPYAADLSKPGEADRVVEKIYENIGGSTYWPTFWAASHRDR